MIDQYGGETGEKFRNRRFKELLCETGKLWMGEQKQSLLSRN